VYPLLDPRIAARSHAVGGESERNAVDAAEEAIIRA
jgi:peptide/nickel transport system permease protein